MSLIKFPTTPNLSFEFSNKSQSQSLSIVGADLRYAVFTHGQLYIALSRVTTVTGLYILPPAATHAIEYPRLVTNIVYTEVLLP